MRKQLQQLAIKGQQWAVQMFCQHHEFGVVAGAAVAVGQLQGIAMGNGHCFGAKPLLGRIQMGKRLGKIQKPCSQVFQLNVTKFEKPERWNPPIEITNPPFLNSISIGTGYIELDQHIGISNKYQDSGLMR